jgi:hypothetical protein
MKAVLLPAALAVAVMGLAFNSTPAPAKGCIKGAIVGGNTSSLIPAMAAVLPIIKTHAKPAG